ncbi:MAG: hypothetical protein JST94_03310 [Bacteroidetes bacterium]|nr:hypothetical protein [Bacteroidota bacterium]MBS1642241.1 hypothetical protein [Bacteroidota bacterium]MBS1670466.1 hypothetical protein [Bacteroidota bacterium]
MSLVISEIKLYELLKAKIGEKEAEAFVQILESKVDTRLQEKTQAFATKEDIARLETKIVESKVDTIKWLIGLSIASYGILMASMKFFFHL